MPTYYSPVGNPEVWDYQPEGYFTVEEWEIMHHDFTPEEIFKKFQDAIQRRLDTFALTRAYDGILSAASYATSLNPKFKAEGQYAVEARDATWAAAYVILDDVMSERRPMPTIEEVLNELPTLEWPV